MGEPVFFIDLTVSARKMQMAMGLIANAIIRFRDDVEYIQSSSRVRREVYVKQ